MLFWCTAGSPRQRQSNLLNLLPSNLHMHAAGRKPGICSSRVYRSPICRIQLCFASITLSLVTGCLGLRHCSTLACWYGCVCAEEGQEGREKGIELVKVERAESRWRWCRAYGVLYKRKIRCERIVRCTCIGIKNRYKKLHDKSLV